MYKPPPTHLGTWRGGHPRLWSYLLTEVDPQRNTEHQEANQSLTYLYSKLDAHATPVLQVASTLQDHHDRGPILINLNWVVIIG